MKLWKKLKERLETYLISLAVKEYIGKHLDSIDEQLLLHENRIDYILERLENKNEKH